MTILLMASVLYSLKKPNCWNFQILAVEKFTVSLKKSRAELGGFIEPTFLENIHRSGGRLKRGPAGGHKKRGTCLKYPLL